MSKRFLIQVASQHVVVVMCFSYGIDSGITGFASEHKEGPHLYDAKGKRDPFVPFVKDGRLVGTRGGCSQALEPSSLSLAGILWDRAGRSIALINETEVTVGDTIGGYEVTAIRQDAVVLVREGTSVVLHVTVEEPDQSNVVFQRGGDRR